MIYQLPPPQSDKLDLLHVQPEQVVEKVAASGGREIAKALLQTVQGMSPLTCREAENYAIRGENIQADEMDALQKQRLGEWLSMLQLRLREHSGVPLSYWSHQESRGIFHFCQFINTGAH